jgi:two-component system sensor histidine kinase HydH
MTEPNEAATLDRAREEVTFLSQLAGGLAHEIKNPLSTMAINLALLEEDWLVEADASPRETRSLRRIRVFSREVKRLENILEEFLRFARRGEVNRAPADLGRIIAQVAEFMEPEHAELGIRQHLELPSSLPLVLVDEDRIKQVLVNLFRNAAQAMPEGGELLVRLSLIGNHVPAWA